MDITALAAQYEQYVIGLRREFHQHPELSLQEQRTAARIQEELERFGIPSHTVGKYNVVGVLEGAKPGRRIAIRADIDALPLTEQNEVPYKSQTDGVMHACGHDGHTAILLGTARVLAELPAVSTSASSRRRR